MKVDNKGIEILYRRSANEVFDAIFVLTPGIGQLSEFYPHSGVREY
jgi:hypothetical protein